MSEFPLGIEPKEDTPERLAALATIQSKYVIYAEDFNKLVRSIEELNARDIFIKSGKAVYLQAPDNIAEQDKTENDWAITVNGNGNLIISQYDGDDVDGNPIFKNEREYEKN